MQYITNGISAGQMQRFYNALDEAFDSEDTCTFDPDTVRVEIVGEDIERNYFDDEFNEDKYLDIDTEFTENYYQTVLGFKMNLFTVEHKGLWKVFKDAQGNVLKSLVLMPAMFDEN